MSDPVRAATLVAVMALLAAGPGVAGPATAGTAARTATHYQVSSTLRPSTVRFGHRVTVTGTVRPRAPGATVKLQLFSEGTWHSVARAELTRRSTFVASYAPSAAGDYLLRVRKPAGDGRRRGTSRTMTLTVTPSLPPM